jgi:hypothetical protein
MPLKVSVFWLVTMIDDAVSCVQRHGEGCVCIGRWARILGPEQFFPFFNNVVNLALLLL